MPDSVKHIEELGIIEVHSSIILSTEDISSSINLINHISKETGITKVLVNTLQVESMPNINSILNLTKVFPRNVKIAVICSEEQPIYKDILCIETAALYQGISFRLFTSQTDAFQWLNR